MMDRPIVLAIETSQREGGVAVRDRQGNVHAEPLAAELRHDDDLLPAVDRLFARLGLKPADLGNGGSGGKSGGGVVGVSIGPGGFTGLRIAVSTAKVLGETLGAKLVAVPSALVAAESVGEDEVAQGTVLVALACKGEGFWETRLTRERGGHWKVIGEPGPSNAAEVDLEDLSAVIGDAFLPPNLRTRCESAGIPIIEPRFDAAACLEVSLRLLEQGHTVDALELSPLYAREPEAVSLWEKRRRERQA